MNKRYFLNTHVTYVAFTQLQTVRLYNYLQINIIYKYVYILLCRHDLCNLEYKKKYHIDDVSFS